MTSVKKSLLLPLSSQKSELKASGSSVTGNIGFIRAAIPSPQSSICPPYDTTGFPMFWVVPSNIQLSKIAVLFDEEGHANWTGGDVTFNVYSGPVGTLAASNIVFSITKGLTDFTTATINDQGVPTSNLIYQELVTDVDLVADDILAVEIVTPSPAAGFPNGSIEVLILLYYNS